jgi:large subunit ribosomal protein L24
MQRVRRDDRVQVISGKDAGKRGRVIRVLPKQDRVLVEGLNLATKHQRVQRTRSGAQEGGIIQEEAPIHLSNVMPVCSSCDKPTRVGSQIVDGVRVRVCRACDAEL